MRKKIITKLTIIISVLLLAGSLLLARTAPASAEEALPDTEPIAAEETSLAEEAEDHSYFSSGMLAAAKDRYGVNKRGLLRNVAPDSPADSGKILDYASMPYTGTAYVLAFHVDFPEDEPYRHFEEGDTAEALQSAIGIDLSGTKYAPLFSSQYANVNGYYQRASYGKLSIFGDVYTYQAKNPRDSYSDSALLIKEIMDTLDPAIDFSRYDANGDRLIDCIYLHIPHDPFDEWSTTWWPNCSTLRNEENMVYDEVQAASRVIISREMNTEEGIQTLIHETGHAMGFPDYYSYDKTPDPTGGSNTLSGILTFDMMDSDSGDHNGFSKWIAGWLDDSDVTIVNANADGVIAKRGGERVGTVNADGSVTLELESFDFENPEDIEKTGGIIVVGNDVRSPFAKYFLIQYDTFAGNQKVYYIDNGDQELPSGFRVFRVQADIDQYGQMQHTNTYGSLYDKLIELVDPDYKENHTLGNYHYIPRAFNDKSYNCMFYGDSSLTPTSHPSTNFRDNIDVGFTGISIEFLESNETSGKLKISYSEEDKPAEVPLEVTLTEGVAIPGGFQATLKGNKDLVLSFMGPGGISASVKEGEEFIDTDSMSKYSLEGDTLTATFYFDTDILLNNRTVVVRCRTGAFDLGTDEYSDPFEFEVPLSPDIVTLSESGYVEGTEAEGLGHALSPIRRAEDGSYYFYGHTGAFLPTASTDMYQYTFTEEDPANVTQTLLAPGSEERKTAVDCFIDLYLSPKTEGVSILPENAQLGDYTEVMDAVKIGDYYYTVSFLASDHISDVPNRMAVSKLDADGRLLGQVLPAGDEIPQEPAASSRARILVGPDDMIAVTLFRPFQDRSYNYPGYLSGHMATFFFDRNLHNAGRLDNYSTGCGTWLEDGRYITFGQRNKGTQDAADAGIARADLICYDITGVIGPPAETDYDAISETDTTTPTWEPGSDDGLLFEFFRLVNGEKDNETIQAHFRRKGIVKVGNRILTEGKDYTVRFASVHITLLPAFLETLSEGTYTLTVEFDDGQASIEFVIRKSTPSPAPDTGDSARPVLWIILMAAALCVVIAVVVILLIRKRRK